MRKRYSLVVAASALLAGIAISSQAQTPATGEFAPPALRIPEGARPTHYAVMLTIVPGDAKAPGEIAIDVELDRPHPVLWLNADTLVVTRAAVDDAATRVTVVSGSEQFVGIAFDPPLPAGKHRLTLAFEAEQSLDSTRGIFALQDRDAWYTMTQFEAVSARRAFPCFDEPGFKVPWQLTLRVPWALVALSNTPVVSETDAEPGMKLVRFAETRPLPSYLVAFAVGPWERIELGRLGTKPTPTGIVVPQGRTGDTAFAARAYPELFDRLERWFGIPYPYEKLDHIAIPISVTFAMENVGLITYGAPAFLAKPGAESPRYRRIAANIGTHEISHQWFGNLVTTAWWDDIWLNEAFATWIAEKIVNQWRPDYDRGAARITERAEAIDADALTSARRIREPITTRGDIFNAFDRITYQKGATVIGMFEGWIGEDPFRRGVHDYLESRRDGTATVDDFLAALTKASRLPVAPAFSTFLNQNGVPQVDVTLQCASGGARLELTQHRLALVGAAEAGAQRWQIPVCARYGVGTASRRTCALLTQETTMLPLGGSCPSFVYANAGGRGYYVPDYRGNLLRKLAVHRNALSTPEYASLLYDMRALVQAGSVSGAQALEWVRMAGPSRDRHVVLAAIDLGRFVGDTLVDDSGRAGYSAFVRQVFGARARALGYVPKPNETDDEQLMRRALIQFVGPEDPQLAAEARRLARAWIGDRHAIDPGLVDAVLIVAARTGDAALFDALLAEAKTAPDRLDRRNMMMALLAFTEPTLARKGMGILLDPDFDVRESTTALRSSFWDSSTRREKYAFIESNFDALANRVSRDTPGSWSHYASGLCSEADRMEVAAFWKDRAGKYPGGERELAQALESIQLCTRLRSKYGSEVAALLRVK